MSRPCDFLLGQLAAHGDHLGELKVGVLLHLLGDLRRVDVRQVHVQQDDVGAELLGGDAGGEPALGDLDLVLGLVLEDLLEHLDDVLLAVDDQDAGAAGHQPVERHPVMLHEPDELVERDAAVLAAGDAVAVQRPESNHLLTVRGATLQILATSPVVSTSFTFMALICIFSWEAHMAGVGAGNKPIPHEAPVLSVSGRRSRVTLVISTCGVEPLEQVNAFCRLGRKR